MPLESVAYGPFTIKEIPEALLVRVLRPLRAGGTAALEVFNQDPAYVATVSIQAPGGSVTSRSCDILDPQELVTAYPDDFLAPEEGWVRVIWLNGDLDVAGTYTVQVTLDNGVVRLKSTEVWTLEVNAGPAEDVT